MNDVLETDKKGTVNREISIINEIEQFLAISIPQVKTVRTGIIGYKFSNNHVTGLVLNSLNCEGILERIFALENLETLILNDTEINEIPDSIKNMKKLSELSFRQNFIQIIPKNLFELTNLRFLNLSNNRLRDFHVNEGQLPLIRIIALENNLIDCVTIEENSCLILEALYLNNNNLTKLNIENLINLRYLALQYNKLIELPDLKKLNKLISLELDFNGLTDIANIVDILTNLETFSISYNRIEKIDFTNPSYRKIPHFFFNDNPLDKTSKKQLSHFTKTKSKPKNIFFS